MIHVGDCTEIMRRLEADSFDAIVTDPPYHLTNNGGGPGKGNDNPYSRARAGATTTGFMGQAWDGGDVAFRPETWAEALRVAKPGAHLVAFGGTRTFHRMMCAIEDAGWVLRDTLMWVYGQGFPKSMNLDAPWQGWGTGLKPAWEPIVLARKPITLPNVASNMEAFGTGALNIDACRIPAEHRDAPTGKGAIPARHDTDTPRAAGFVSQPHDGGRWPANLIHDGSADVVSHFPTDAGANAPVTNRSADKFRHSYGAFSGEAEAGNTFQGDGGSAARFFYCAKASPEDRGEGNTHPTVKPTELMRWLIRLVVPAGGHVLDPFAGSGSTGKAASLEGAAFTGIELHQEHVDIAVGRIQTTPPGLALA